MQEMLNDNTAGELHYKIATQEQSWLSPWLILKEYSLDEYSMLLFTELFSIHHLIGPS
jgi:hypothetical protein